MSTSAQVVTQLDVVVGLSIFDLQQRCWQKMAIGGVLISVLAGSIVSAASLYLGASIMFAFSLYVGVGVISILGVMLVSMLCTENCAANTMLEADTKAVALR